MVDNLSDVDVENRIKAIQPSTTEGGKASEKLEGQRPTRKQEEEVIMELLLFVQHMGGRANLEDIEGNLNWREKFEPVYGPLAKLLERLPMFALAPDLNSVTVLNRGPDATKRGPREKSRLRKSAPSAHGKVACICVADSIDVVSLQKMYKRLDYNSVLGNGVLHVTNVKGYGSTMDSAARFDLFVFSYGSVVWWGTDMDTYRFVEKDFLRGSNIATALKDRYPATLDDLFPVWCTFAVVEDAEEDLTTSVRFLEALQRDHILLQSDRPAFKQTISHALAQSAKLDVIEPMISELLALCKPLPLQIRDKGHADISNVRVSQLKGKLFLYRMMLKSDSELLDEPDFFWEYSWFKPLFKTVREEYSIESRVNLLDEKLTAVQETLSMIGEQFEQDHAIRLEMIVIVLILIEVIIAIMELCLELGFGTGVLGLRPTPTK